MNQNSYPAVYIGIRSLLDINMFKTVHFDKKIISYHLNWKGDAIEQILWIIYWDVITFYADHISYKNVDLFCHSHR
jgi:hypothetical protein